MTPRRLLRDRQGAVAPMIAALGASLVGAAGLAVDVGVYYAANRDLRAATEAAALAAAMNPAQASTRARESLSRNGFDPAILRSVELGRYCPDAHLTSDQRFDPSLTRCTGSGSVNAVRVRTGKPSRRFLTRMLGSANPIPDLDATAAAARIDEAGIGITSGILTVTNSLVNSVNDLLGALIGVQLRLNSGDIEAMLASNIDAGHFFDALAVRVGETGTYEDLTRRTVSLRDLLHAAATAAERPTTAATLTLLADQVGSGYMVPLSGLFGLGVWKNMPVGEADDRPALRAGINAYQLFAFAAQSGTGRIDLSDALSRAVGGSTVVIAGVASGPMDRPRFSFGPAGETSVGTSALRLKLEVGLNVSLLGIGVDPIPVLIDIAAARAEVSSIACPDTPEQARDSRVSVLASSGLVNAYIGKPPANAMSRPMPPLSASDITQERIINLLLITAHIRAVAQPVMGNSGTLTFGPGYPGRIGQPGLPGTPISIGNGSQLGPLLNSLISSLGAPDGLVVSAVGLPLLRGQLLSAITAPLIGLVGNTVDPLLDNLLAALGIQLGHATVWATGVRCGVPVLI